MPPVAEPAPSFARLSTYNGPMSESTISVSSLGGDIGPTPQLDGLLRGFEILSVGASITLAIQGQLISLTGTITNRSGESASITAVNTLFISGLVIDGMAATISYFTSRWLQRLTPTEKLFLEFEFEWQEGLASRLMRHNPVALHLSRKLVAEVGGRNWLDHERMISFFAISLFSGLPLLSLGAVCLALGILVYAWSQQTIVVGVLVSLAFFSTLPFLIAILLVGRKEERRRRIITSLSRRRRVW